MLAAGCRMPAPVMVRIDDRHAGLAARHEAQLGGMVDDHVHGHRGEVHQHDLGDGLVADEAAPIAAPMIACSEIGVERTRCSPNVVDRPLGDADDAAVLRVGDVLAEHDDLGVGRHRVGERQLIACEHRHLLSVLAVGLRAHASDLLGIDIAASARSSAGYGDASANSTASSISASMSASISASCSSVAIASRDQPWRGRRIPGSAAIAAAFSSLVHVGVGVAEHVAVEAEGHGLDQRRAVAGAGALDRLARRGVHRERVVAVDMDAGHAVGRRAVGDLRPPACALA